MNNYLLKSTNTYRVDDEASALKLREELINTVCGNVVAFSYKIKETKTDYYVLCQATIEFTLEKEPEIHVIAEYKEEF